MESRFERPAARTPRGAGPGAARSTKVTACATGSAPVLALTDDVVGAIRPLTAAELLPVARSADEGETE